MPTELFDQRGSEVLTRAECKRLLTSSHGRVGRLGFHEDGRIVIRPINFMMVEEDLLFRIGPGSMLEFATREAEVAFETDLIDRQSSPPLGWSVTAHGQVQIIDDPIELSEAAASGLTPLVTEPGEVYLRMTVSSLAGRRFAVNPLARVHLDAVVDPSPDPAPDPQGGQGGHG